MTEQLLNGKVALVTGASRGMGKTIAEELARRGAKVVVNYASSPEKAEAVVKGIQAEGGEAVAIQADVSKLAELEKLFQKTKESFGRLDILINNAGVMVTKPLKDITEEDFDRQFAINVKGTFFAIQKAVDYMEAGGRIINFSTSVTGQMFPTYSSYAASKGAVEQITRQLAKELGPLGITINAVGPGPVNTELFTVGKTPEQIKAVGNTNAFGRLAEPEDITSVVLFLAGPESGWVTGQTIRVNGGFI
ncbi:SDR family oxidoreductase [Paenibacillus barengoltzii]|uniref:3-oxoacyl-[acyl-carrier protein] reductase n=1 Tax=Paenibacillus barengoltzii G22 TaxID=1235795 RepID=R9L6K2_9BACL|nr:SDR family oxidoreductase [Paenibacillus barengoltzii]EOS54198.1 3-oxoacyl-[acyl-carrier protein] reductase [Paenibacillus barengoltzii G22]